MESSAPLILLIVAMGLAPGIFWLFYFLRKDRLEPEPARYVIGMYFWGLLPALAALLVQTPLSYLLPWVLMPILVAPVTEELLKFFFLIWALRLFAGFRKEFDEPMDGIVYAAAVALGFASLENIGYLAIASMQDKLTTVFVIRALLSVPAHVLFSGMWGYALGMSRCAALKRDKKKASVLWGVIMAVFFHGIFNGLAYLDTVYTSILLLLAVLLFWRIAFRNIRSAILASPHMGGEKDKY
ncbi:MAG: PrsW family intramembrane metalloprotease [Planctomycetota bacterium]|jgi:RsiW-degrading membrane proteinase PrsW (M82 family)